MTAGGSVRAPAAPSTTDDEAPRYQPVDVAITLLLLALGAAAALRLTDPASIGAGDTILALEIAAFLIVLTVFGRHRNRGTSR